MEEYKAVPEYMQQAHARAFADLRKMKARQDTHISRTPDGRVFMRRVFRKPIVGGC